MRAEFFAFEERRYKKRYNKMNLCCQTGNLPSLSALGHMTIQEVGGVQTRRISAEQAGTLISDQQPPELSEINFCCF